MSRVCQPLPMALFEVGRALLHWSAGSSEIGIESSFVDASPPAGKAALYTPRIRHVAIDDVMEARSVSPLSTAISSKTHNPPLGSSAIHMIR